MTVFRCKKCNCEFATQEDLDNHFKIYFYSDGMDAAAKHDLASLEQTVSYLIYSRELVEKAKNEIYQEYGRLEREYHRLLDGKSKPLPIVQTEQKRLLEVVVS